MGKILNNNIPPAEPADYVTIQGGYPQVRKEGKLTVITHNYPLGKGMVVRSHIDHGTVILNTPRGFREFKIDLLRQFHGEPCERQSRRVGGEGYDRE